MLTQLQNAQGNDNLLLISECACEGVSKRDEHPDGELNKQDVVPSTCGHNSIH